MKKAVPRKVELLFDTIRAPYDMAHIVQIAQAIDCVVYTTGLHSLAFDMPKVASKVRSWGIRGDFREIHYDSFAEAVVELRAQGKYLIGTSGDAEKVFYNVELSANQSVVLVFGTESSGLTLEKQWLLDEVVKLPMDEARVDFLTLPVVVSAMAYELERRYRFADAK